MATDIAQQIASAVTDVGFINDCPVCQMVTAHGWGVAGDDPAGTMAGWLGDPAAVAALRELAHDGPHVIDHECAEHSEPVP